MTDLLSLSTKFLLTTYFRLPDYATSLLSQYLAGKWHRCVFFKYTLYAIAIVLYSFVFSLEQGYHPIVSYVLF